MKGKAILFKAKRIDGLGWEYGYPVITAEGCFMFYGSTKHCVECDPETVCESTGLRDTYQTPIFEGDIVETQEFRNKRDKSTKTKRFYGIVEYQVKDGDNFLNTETGEFDKYSPISSEFNVRILDPNGDLDKYPYFSWGWFFDCRVVGNVFDNEDLIKDGGYHE